VRLAADPKQTIYKWRTMGEGPWGFRVGKHLRYDWRNVEAWLDVQREHGS
jgi:hypothetical protein